MALPKETAQLDDSETDISSMFDDEIDDELVDAVMPDGYKRCYKNSYLKRVGLMIIKYFPVSKNVIVVLTESTTIILFWRFVMRGCVGFVARSILGKEEIDSYNAKHHFKIRRYKNSDERIGNGFF